MRAKYSCDSAGIFIDDGCEKSVHLFAARFAPKIFESLAFDLARKKRADTGAGETNPDVVNEVRRQDESVGEDATNIRRVDIGTCGRAASAAFRRPVVEQRSRRVGASFPRTCSAAIRRCRGCPPTGQSEPRCFGAAGDVLQNLVPVLCPWLWETAVSVKNRVGLAWATPAARVRSSM